MNKTYNFNDQNQMINWLQLYYKQCKGYKYPIPYHKIEYKSNTVTINPIN